MHRFRDLRRRDEIIATLAYSSTGHTGHNAYPAQAIDEALYAAYQAFITSMRSQGHEIDP